MGGAPSIDGGMSAAEHRAALEEERAYQKMQEEERRKAAEASEARRVSRELAERQRIKREEEEAIQLATKGEQEAVLEAQAAASGNLKEGIAGASSTALDFYSSMYSGITNPTATPVPKAPPTP